MSESAKTLGQILVDIEANYGGCLWDFMSDSARQLVERTAKEFAKHIRSESASEIERLREALEIIRRHDSSLVEGAEVKSSDVVHEVENLPGFVRILGENGKIAHAALSKPQEASR